VYVYPPPLGYWQQLRKSEASESRQAAMLFGGRRGEGRESSTQQSKAALHWGGTGSAAPLS